jgi:putative DNA primase/helicase
MFGCWGWSERDLTFAKGRLVYVILDADLATNRKVWEAAKALHEHLMKTVKAAAVRFVILPAAGSQGLDDYLADIEDDGREQALITLLDSADSSLPKAPAANKVKKNPRYFNESGGIKPLTVAKALQQALPMALTAENQVAVYRKGVYRTSSLALITAMVQMLKDDYRHDYLGTVGDVLMGVLDAAGHRLPKRLDQPMINCLNGMVDLRTGELQEHDSAWMSAVQFPIHYDPAATCPTFDKWAEDIGITGQLPALLESASVMLDPTKIPQRALLLFGPARSGKSTFLRLLENIAGMENRSGISLHELAEDQFAAASVYGKVLNVSADLSARHLQDVTKFKLMTGEDVVRGNRKYGKDFFFRSTALFTFSANEIPTVGESSRAYAERMDPFEFACSFADRPHRPEHRAGDDAGAARDLEPADPGLAGAGGSRP